MSTISRSQTALKLFCGATALATVLLTMPGASPARAAGSSPDNQPIATSAKEAILVDFETGTVLLDKNADERMAPSSMSKLMTAVMIFDRLRDGSLSLDEKFRVSANAWRKGGAASGGSTMFLRPNQEVRVEDLLRGIIVQSGNDACIVAAENLMGSEENFAQAMNRRAKEIGLKNSHFANATGLPEDDHYMTARDLEVLARFIINTYPEYHAIYSEKDFTFNGIHQSNRNPLLYTMKGADGLKTGHTSVGGYGLTGTAKSGDRRQILVINGLDSVKARARESEKLMNWGFRNFENKTLFTKGETVSTADVWLGKQDTVPLMATSDLRFTLPLRAVQNLDVKVVYTGPIPAPIQKGQEVASLKISGADMAKPISVPLVAAEDVERLGFFGRLMEAAKAFVLGATTQKGETVAPAASGSAS